MALITKYPDNFMIGSDAVGRFGDYPDQIRVYDALFKALGDPGLVAKLAQGNFLRIARKEGVVLDADYSYPENLFSQRPPVRSSN